MNSALAQTVNSAATKPVTDAFDLFWLKINAWLQGFVLLLPNLIVAAVISVLVVLFAFGSSSLVKRWLMRNNRRDLGHVLSSFVFWGVLILGSLVVITIVVPSVRPVDAFAGLGIGSVALGFAFKDMLQNQLAGLLILIRRPFKRGDQIRIGEIEGTVQAVETRATLVKTYNGKLVIIPNSDIYTRSVVVNTAYDIRRTEVMVPLGMEVDLEKAIEIFDKAVRSVDHVLDDPAPDILPWEFAENNVNVRVRWWMKSQRAFEVRTRSAVVRAIKLASEKAGIDIPADTKVSFATTPLVVTDEEPRAKPATKKKVKPQDNEPAEVTVSAPPADERHDPEAEMPKEGELNKGVQEVPR